ncbi:ribosomal RNA processing protein 1 homolog [Trichoplusia ni]|uniref:Ribosomal RNA processing protein 1 homolog n=1 Tax=Trichoplusia ni TaxID=7111 RepID=A0A7E5WHI2_TRINI|nr:ribosomal RNA processing protein 1 homolog [Trichoplusia ni]
MKIPEKKKEKKDKTKKKQNIKPKKEHVLIVAQEFKFARLLSGNEKKTRDRVLKTLKKWLLNCFEKGYEFKEDDFIRVWKGLFYAVWMSDKPLIQEELCENIAGVLDLFPPEQLQAALLMFHAGLRVLASEWYGLDQHRTDKFLMLVRRYLRASLRCLARCDWSLKSCQLYAKTLSDSNGIFAVKTPHYARNATSMLLHFVDCYLEEIAKVSGGSIPGSSLCSLLQPLLQYLVSGATPSLRQAARRLLSALLRQSQPGVMYQEATRAWQKMGCPEGGPESLELVSDDEDDDEQNGVEVTDDEDESTPTALDPRAGRVDVVLPTLPVPAEELATLIRSLLPTAASGRHKTLRICLERFEQLSRNEYPLRVQTHTEDEEPSPPARVRRNRSAAALHALEKKLVANSDELALRGLSRKHRKRLLAKSRAGASIVEETLRVREKLSTQANGDWIVEPAEPEPKKLKQTPAKNEKKRKNKAMDAGDKKRRKPDTNIKEAAEQERLKVAEKPQVVNKLENNLKKVVNGKIEKKTLQNGNVEKKDKAKLKKSNQNKLSPQVPKPTVNNIPEKQNNINKKEIVTPKLVQNKNPKTLAEKSKNVKQPTVLVNKVKTFQKQTKKIENSDKNNHFDTPKKVKFVLKNNSMQQPFDYYKSVRQSPNIPFDSSRKPSKTNLKPSTPSPINPFFKKKLKLRK